LIGRKENIMAKNTTDGNENGAAIAASAFSPTIHLILQGKGGVGKNFVASWLAEFLIGRRSIWEMRWFGFLIQDAQWRGGRSAESAGRASVSGPGTHRVPRFVFVSE
jgi:hypothetical protein